jgi:hypothetical protein
VSTVKINDKLTEFFATKLGVKQGTDNLSPNLFKIFINNLPSYLSNTKDPVILDNSPIHSLIQADNIVLLSKSAEGMQEKLDKLSAFCTDWCLDINIQNFGF